MVVDKTQRFYRHTYKVVVLSESPDEDDLYSFCYRVTEGPDCLHTWERLQVEELTGEEAAAALIEANSDPDFLTGSSEESDDADERR